MKPYLLQTLKELALLGAIRNKIELSSHELAKQLETSQQTASRYLLELDTQQMITRELGVKKQLIQITSIGADLLENAYLSYKQIFDLSTKVAFKGKLISGMGEGKYYTEQKGYADQFKKQLGFVAHPGTFNVEIEYIERNKLRLLRNCGGILINEFQAENRTFGNVVCFKATINGYKGAIVLPKRSHYAIVLECISPYYLREKLGLHDGDEVEVIVYLQ
ncbi:Riboflavin kinase [uncultured archaeon]|nr:Riboflavin kinase [uncultured archaeon]